MEVISNETTVNFLQSEWGVNFFLSNLNKRFEDELLLPLSCISYLHMINTNHFIIDNYFTKKRLINIYEA
jgi:hypothetical protein